MSEKKVGWYIDCFSILAFTFVGEGYARAAEVMITGKGSPHQIKLIHASFVRRVALPFSPLPTILLSSPQFFTPHYVSHYSHIL